MRGWTVAFAIQLQREPGHLDPAEIPAVARRCSGASATWTPEQRLAYAMVAHALRDLRGPHDDLRRDALGWLGRRSARLTWRTCCEALGIDADAAAARLVAEYGGIRARLAQDERTGESRLRRCAAQETRQKANMDESGGGEWRD